MQMHQSQATAIPAERLDACSPAKSFWPMSANLACCLATFIK
jgi:NADH:ubiquinone oxidoreductase subunit B-like Fe-S oxidoreductase